MTRRSRPGTPDPAEQWANTSDLRPALIVNLVFLFLLVFAFGNHIARAQQSTGDILGIVTDPSGASIPNATITYTNVGTHDSRTVQSDRSGAFDFPNLNPGSYMISVTANGFIKATSTTFDLLAGDRHRVDTQLKVGAATETIEVETTTTAIQTDSSAITNSVTTEEVANLPLNGRNYVELVRVTPGATEGNPAGLSSGQRPDDRRQGSNVSINAQSDVLNNNMIDGLDNNERIIGTIGVRPSIDAIQEIKILTNDFNADSGRAAGAVVNIITKSGTNTFHGSLYEYFRNDKLNAVAYQFGGHNPKPKLRQNQFGGSLGGPIFKDRTFFFGDVEFFRLIQQQNPANVTVPTGFELANPGNFSDITTALAGNSNTLYANGSTDNCNSGGLPITDPSNYVPGCAYNPATGLQYAGNIIPNSAIDPVGLAYFQLYPTLNGAPGHTTANFPGGVIDPSGNGNVSYVNSFNKVQYSTVYDIRVDHKISSSNSIFGRYTENSVFTHTPALALPPETVKGILIDPEVGLNGDSPQTARNVQANYTHTFTPNVLMLLGAGWTYVNNFAAPTNYGLNPNNAFGEPGVNFSQQTSALGGVLPGGGLEGFGGGSPGNIPLQDKDNTYQISGAVFYTKGTHSFKFGSSVIRRQAYAFQEDDGMGTISFNNGAPGLLTGFYTNVDRSNNFFQGKEIAQYYRTWEPSAFAADDWRATKKLTLNMGIRWDMFTPYVEKYDHIANFFPDNGGTLVPANQNGASRAANVAYNYKNFQPRLGFAYNPVAGTVIRGGYGISYFPTNYASVAALRNVPFVYPFNCNNGVNCPAGFGFLRQGLPLPGVVDPANPNELNFNCIVQADYTAAVAVGVTPAVQPNSNVCLGQAMNSSVPRYKDAYLEQFNLAVQQEFRKNTITVAYVGLVGRHLGDSINDTNLSPIGTINASNASKPNAGTLENDTRVYFKKFPNLGAVPASLSDGANSYHSLQATIQRRFSNGLGYIASTTWSHALDNISTVGGGGGTSAISLDPSSPYYHNRYDYGNSQLDTRNRFVFSGNYAPTFLAHRHGLLGAIAGGWEGNVLSVWSTGLPFNVTNNSLRSKVSRDLGSDRPNLIGNPFSNVPASPAGRVAYISKAAFQAQAFGTGGNLRRNAFYAPPHSHVDASLAKTFPLYERARLNFRAEGFNLLNSVSFNSPTTNLGSGNFGRISATRADYSPRVFQLALRVEF
jgi:hypothetical protein